MSSYKTFLNGVRAAVKKVECKVDGFIKRATDKYNELAYVPIYETPIEDVWSGEITNKNQEELVGFPPLVVGSKYRVTIGDNQYDAVAKVYTNGSDTVIYISDVANPFVGSVFSFTIISVDGGALAFWNNENVSVGDKVTIQLVGDPVEVGKEWLHDYVDGKDDKLTEAVKTAQSTAETAKSTAETAKSTAETAKSTAETAKSTAETAKSTAETAKSTAETAKSTAETAKSTAETAKSTAETAKSTAETAKSTADNVAEKAIVLGGEKGCVLTLDAEISGYHNERELVALICAEATSIADQAVQWCTNLKTLYIPKVKTIGLSAIYACESLTSIAIPSCTENIEGSAFNRCHDIASITVEKGNAVYHSDGNCLIKTAAKRLVIGCKNSVIPVDGSVTEIGHSAFYDNGKLTSITIPESVTYIGVAAFLGCIALNSIIYTGTIEQWNAIYKSARWHEGVPATEVVCSDGSVPLTTET